MKYEKGLMALQQLNNLKTTLLWLRIRNRLINEAI